MIKIKLMNCKNVFAIGRRDDYVLGYGALFDFCCVTPLYV
jgi:hypothetical protein